MAAGQLELILQKEGGSVTRLRAGAAFLASYVPGDSDCVLVALRDPAAAGIDLIRQIRQAHPQIACVGLGKGLGVVATVEAMKAGATDVIQLPISRRDLLATLRQASGLALNTSHVAERNRQALARLATLTDAQREIMALLLAGKTSEAIGQERHLSAEALQSEIAALMGKMQARTLPDLARIAPSGQPGA